MIMPFWQKWVNCIIVGVQIIVIFLLVYENGQSINIVGASILFILFSLCRLLFFHTKSHSRLNLHLLWVQLAIAFYVACFDYSFISSIYLYFLISEVALIYSFRKSFFYMMSSYFLYVISRLIVFDFPAFQEISFVIPRSLEFVTIYAAFFITKIAMDQKEELEKAYEKLDESSKKIDTLMIENERMRISREIHDSVGHVLTNTIVGVATVKKIMHIDQEKAVTMLDGISVSAQEGLEEVRATVHNMKHTNAFPDYRLAIEQLLLKIEQNTEVQIIKEIPPCIPIYSPQVKLAVYRMIQEGITNGLRHSKTDQFTCLITVSKEHVEIRLEDNGIGFELSTKKGFGLKAMKERIEECGGVFQIATTPGNGTVITCKVPVESKGVRMDETFSTGSYCG